MDSVLSIAASIAAILAAAISGYGAYKALQHANSAKGFRDEVIRRRGIIELTRVHAETIRILQLISNSVGPTCTQKSTRGVNTASVAKQVEEYARFLNEHSGHFDVAFMNSARSLCADLKSDIELLASAKSFEEIQSSGKSIYYKINDFLPVVKRDADEVREQL